MAETGSTWNFLLHVTDALTQRNSPRSSASDGILQFLVHSSVCAGCLSSLSCRSLTLDDSTISRRRERRPQPHTAVGCFLRQNKDVSPAAQAGLGRSPHHQLLHTRKMREPSPAQHDHEPIRKQFSPHAGKLCCVPARHVIAAHNTRQSTATAYNQGAQAKPPVSLQL